MISNKNRKRGFTIVELVIVIAVIAILAAVLIPTFTSLVNKANLSADQVAVKNMNTVLLTEDEPESLKELREILVKNGFVDKASPVTANHRFYWDSEENKIILVDTEKNVAVYPDGATYTQGDTRWLPLDGIPEATVTALTGNDLNNKTLHDQNGNEVGATINFDAGLKYVAVDENISNSDYADYEVDFRLTFSKAVTYDENYENDITDGMVGFMLIGSYGSYENVPLQVTTTKGTINDDGSQTVRIMKDVFQWTPNYKYIVEDVKEITCGIKAVYDNRYNSNEFPGFDAQTMDEADKAYLNGLEVTVELCLYDNADNVVAVVDTYTYTYNID